MQVLVTDVDVTSVRVTWKQPIGHFDGFRIECVGGTRNATSDIMHSPSFHLTPSPPPVDPPRESYALPQNSSLAAELSHVCEDLTPGALYDVTVSTTIIVVSRPAPAPPRHHVTSRYSVLHGSVFVAVCNLMRDSLVGAVGGTGYCDPDKVCASYKSKLGVLAIIAFYIIKYP